MVVNHINPHCLEDIDNGFGGKYCGENGLIFMNQQEQLAIQIRHALGEYNKDAMPVVLLVSNLARMNRDQAKLLGACQDVKDKYIKEGFRVGMGRAADICEGEANYCLEHYHGTHEPKWMNDALVAEKLEQAIRSEISNDTDNT